MKNIKKGLILLGLALTVSSCYYDDIQDVPVIPTEVSFTLDIQPILNNNCIACHDGTIVAEPDLRDGNSYSALMSLPAGSIIPGDAAGSELMEMLNHNPANPNPMPPGAPMANRNITLFGNWIDQGAKNN